MVGVWDWRKGELLAKAPGLVARPLGVHQLAVAPYPLAVDAQGRRTLMFTLVGVANAPKFGTLAPVAGAGPTRWALTFELGKLNAKQPPASISCVAYGGPSFPAPSGAEHGLTFVGGSFGGIYVFDAPANTTALRSVRAHDGPISSLLATGGGLASGGADGFVHLWAAPAAAATGSGGGGGGAPGELERVHTYQFRAVDHGREPAAPTAHRGANSNPNSVVGAPRAAKPPKPPQPVSATKPAGTLPTTGNGGVGAIRSLALVPLGPKRTVASNRRLQIPTLYVGTARCSIWRLEPQRGVEVSVGHFGAASAVAAHPTRDGVWASCGADRQLLIWRESERLPLSKMLLAKPASCLAYASDGALLAAGHDDGTITVLRPMVEPDGQAGTGGAARTPRAAAPQAPPTHATGSSTAIAVLAFAPSSGGRGGLLACGGHDRTIRIVELHPETSVAAASGAAGSGAGVPRLRLTPRCCCSGHTATVTHLDWSADGTMLMSNCAAHEVLVWAVPAGKRLAQPGRALANVVWADWTCYLGFPCMGIWPEGANGTDVNACHRSSDAGLLVAGGDDGLLKLFNAPCVVEGAPYVEGTGHCSAITCARFLRGDRTLVSSGGNDRAVVLWELVDQSHGRGDDRAAARAPKAEAQAVARLPDQPRRRCMLATPTIAIE